MIIRVKTSQEILALTPNILQIHYDPKFLLCPKIWQPLRAIGGSSMIRGRPRQLSIRDELEKIRALNAPLSGLR